jgi:hypothetical protein
MSLQTFGRLLDRTEVERAVLDTIRYWEKTYLAEIERQNGMDPHALQLIKNYATRNDWKHFPEDQQPALLAISPGIEGVPFAEGDGAVTARFALGVGLIANGQDEEDTRLLTGLYGTAVLAILLQHQQLGRGVDDDYEMGFAETTQWRDLRFNDYPSDQGRTTGSFQAIFVVEVKDVFNTRKGLLVRSADPYEENEPFPTADEVTIETPAGDTIVQED